MKIDITYIGGLSGGFIPRVGKFKRGEPFSVPDAVAVDLLKNNPQDWQGPKSFQETNNNEEKE